MRSLAKSPEHADARTHIADVTDKAGIERVASMISITDFSMPKMNGGRLAVALRPMRPGLPILWLPFMQSCLQELKSIFQVSQSFMIKSSSNARSSALDR